MQLTDLESMNSRAINTLANPIGMSIEYRREADMGVAIFVSIFVGSFVAIALALSGSKAAEDRAHARRMADARMNARLLRLNL
jgi:hypothetical protein